MNRKANTLVALFLYVLSALFAAMFAAWRPSAAVVPAANQLTSEMAGERLEEAKKLRMDAERIEEKWRQARDLAEAWKKAEKSWAEAKRLAEEWEEREKR